VWAVEKSPSLRAQLTRVADDRKEEPSAEPAGNQEGAGETAPPLTPYVQPQDQPLRPPTINKAGALDTNIDQVVWPLLSYPRVLMNVARSLIDQNQFTIAVVVAHMACEVATEQMLSQSFSTKGLEYLKASVTDFLNGYSLYNKRNRKLYVALTGDEVHKATFWSKFKESARRRNNIMHEGLTVDKADAEESYKAADDLLLHFNIK
jgi:hypothetical protein